MAIGDTDDIVGRLKALLPAGWFAGETPVLDAVLAGLADKWAWVFSLTEYARAQARIRTATGSWLDLAARDFFGAHVARLTNEGDTAYRARILANLLPERATRAALIAVVTALTGRAPWVFEPAHTGDTGGYGNGAVAWSGMAYGAAGGWGSLSHPFQAFVVAYRPHQGGVATVGGLSVMVGNLTAAWQGNGDGTVTADVTTVAAMFPGQSIARVDLPINETAIINAAEQEYSLSSQVSLVAAFVQATCVADRTYDAAAWVWIPAGQNVEWVKIQPESGVASIIETVTVEPGTFDGWQRISTRFVASGGAVNLVVRVAYGMGTAIALYLTGARIDLAATAYGAPGGYGTGALEYISRDMIDAQVPDEAIYQAIADVAPAGSIMWTRIEA